MAYQENKINELNNNLLAVSGDGFTTGSLLDGRINSLSGFTLDASGALQAQIVGGAGTEVRITGSTTLSIADFTGLGSVSVTRNGNIVFISGSASQAEASNNDGINLSGNLTQTGIDLISRDNSISGVIQSQIDGLYSSSNPQQYTTSGDLFTTGSILDSRINSLSGFTLGVSGALQAQIAGVSNSDGITISGNLTQTGVQLGAKIDSLSGYSDLTFATIVTTNSISSNLTQTGVDLILRDIAVSGGLEARITQSGNGAITHANGIGLNLSGNLTQTGSVLNIRIDSLSGYSDTTFATITNLQSTGSALQTTKLSTGAFLGLAKITVGTVEPVSPAVGDLWVDTN